MLITKKNNNTKIMYIQTFDINYLSKLGTPLPMTVYLKWLSAKKDENNFILINESELKFINEIYYLLFDFDAYSANPNSYFKSGNNSQKKSELKEAYYLKNIKYIMENNYCSKEKELVKEKKIEV